MTATTGSLSDLGATQVCARFLAQLIQAQQTGPPGKARFPGILPTPGKRVPRSRNRNPPFNNAMLRAIREDLDLSVDAFAGYVNVSPDTVRKWETGAVNPDPRTVGQLSRVLRIDYRAFYGGEHPVIDRPDRRRSSRGRTGEGPHA